jgi:hypothetical protein
MNYKIYSTGENVYFFFLNKLGIYMLYTESPLIISMQRIMFTIKEIDFCQVCHMCQCFGLTER